MDDNREEWRLLQALCQASETRLVGRAGRRELTAQLTRAGFPAIDLDSLFEPPPCPEAELARRIAELRRASHAGDPGDFG
ncbi:MAG TPA: hypothetical protein VGS20_16250 [Candidatus Acidoferrales bacterium]|nr:hypothetical protein [Candidatus Acidoferrales bacterium]